MNYFRINFYCHVVPPLGAVLALPVLAWLRVAPCWPSRPGSFLALSPFRGRSFRKETFFITVAFLLKFAIRHANRPLAIIRAARTIVFDAAAGYPVWEN